MAESSSSKDEIVRRDETTPTPHHALLVSFTRPGDMSFVISTDSTEVAKELCDSTVKLGTIAAVSSIGALRRIGAARAIATIGVIYLYPRVRPIVNGAVISAFGGNKKGEQEVTEIKPGCLHVLLRCFTEARFLEVLEDYESGRITQRLEEEFLKAGIKNKGLKVEIDNMEEVQKRKRAIQERYRNRLLMQMQI